MFENLSERLSGVFDRLTKQGALSEEESSQINALVAIAQRIAVVVSQSPPYKAVFGDVTEAILAHAAPAGRME